MSMPLSLTFVSSVSRISPDPPPNSVWNACLKFSLIALKASVNLFFEILVDLLDRLLGIANGVEQILPLRGQEVLPLLRFLELLLGRRIHRAEVLDLRLRFL